MGFSIDSLSDFSLSFRDSFVSEKTSAFSTSDSLRGDLSPSLLQKFPSSNSEDVSSKSPFPFLAERNLSLEQDADRLRAVEENSFYTKYAAYDHFRMVAEMYGRAASIAESKGDYEYAACLFLKNALVLFEKTGLGQTKAIRLLEAKVFSYQMLKQFPAAQKMASQVLALYDQECDRLTNEFLAAKELQEAQKNSSEDVSDDDSDDDDGSDRLMWNRYSYAQYRMGEAAFCEELGILSDKRSNWYKEMGDIYLLWSHPGECYMNGMTHHTVAALCYEKAGVPKESVHALYQKNLDYLFLQWQEALFYFVSHEEKMPEAAYSSDDEEEMGEPNLFYLASRWSFWGFLKEIEFLAMKVGDVEKLFDAAKFELESIQEEISEFKKLQKIQNEEILPILSRDTALYMSLAKVFASYYSSVDEEKASYFQNKYESMHRSCDGFLKQDAAEKMENAVNLLFSQDPKRSVKEMSDVFERLVGHITNFNPLDAGRLSE